MDPHAIVLELWLLIVPLGLLGSKHPFVNNSVVIVFMKNKLPFVLLEEVHGCFQLKYFHSFYIQLSLTLRDREHVRYME